MSAPRGAAAGAHDRDRVEQVLAAAIEAGADAWTVIARECGADAALRREVESLLAAHADSGVMDRLERKLGARVLAGAARGENELGPGAHIGDFEVRGRLGRGGMGVVYLARDRRDGAAIALKVLAPALAQNPAAVRRFHAEARSAATLDHPNICAVRETGAAPDGALYIAMPAYAGESLQARLARGPLPVAQALEIAAAVAAGLAHAHDRGIVHRDIKPANLLLLDDGTVRILDFGIAKLGDGTLTTAGTVLGTLPYMSPEQASGRAVDQRSDLWSLGVVLYEMVAGRRPFDGAHPDETVAAILGRDPPPLDAAPEARRVTAVLDLLLARDPDDRCPDAATAHAALRAAIAPPSPDGERRHAVVLAVLAPDASPVQVEALRSKAAELTQQRGGVVHPAAGAAVMSLFGIPAAHEDDVARAFRTARALHAWAAGPAGGASVVLRAAVCAGTVLVRPTSDGGPWCVSGDPVDRALRCAAAAAPGVTAGDVAEPSLPLHLAPFAGRDAELSLLTDAAAAARAGTGQWVMVEGEAGAGKSRLVHELVAGDALHGMTLVRVACRAHDGEPARPFAELLRALLALGDTPPRQLAPDAVAASLAAHAPELAASLPLYLHLLGVASEQHPVPPHLDRDRVARAIRDALAALVTSAASRRPLCLVFEDWHWADDASRETLLHLAPLVAAHRVLLVATFRPEYGVQWPHEVRPVTLPLRPLDVAATAVLAGATLGAAVVSAEVAQAVHHRAGGNPFFTEEICRALVEQGGLRVEGGVALLGGPSDGLQLPASVQGVIRTRLDRLDPAARELARTASVIGRAFPLSLLAAAADDGAPAHLIERLRRASLIEQTRLLPEPAYRFRHVLMQEVAYESLVPERRQTLHARVAAALEEAAGTGALEIAEVLAYHFGRAEWWEHAVRYGREETRRAAAHYDFSRALRAADQVAACAERLPDAAARHDALVAALLEQERLCETLGLRDRQQELLARLAALVEHTDDPVRLSEICRRQGELHLDLQEFPRAHLMLERALALAKDAGAELAERDARTALGLLAWHEDRSGDGIVHVERAVAIDRARGDWAQLTRDLYNLSVLFTGLGDDDRALVVLAEAERAAESAADPSFGSHLAYHRGLVYRRQGRAEEAFACMRRAVEIGRAHGLLIERAAGLVAVAQHHLERGETEEAVAHYREAVDAARRLQYSGGLVQALRIFAGALARLGRHDEALVHMREAAAVLAQLRKADSERAVRARIAELEEERGDLRAAAESWAMVRELCRGADPVAERRAALRGARCLRDAGADPGTVRPALADVIALAAEAGDAAAESQARNAAGIFEWTQGEYAAALDHYERALALFGKLGEAHGAAVARNSIGATLLASGRTTEAIGVLEAAAAAHRSAGQRLAEGHALGVLGDACRAAGDEPRAVECYEASLAIRRELGDRRGEGWMLCRLGQTAAASAIAAETHDGDLARTCGGAAAGA